MHEVWDVDVVRGLGRSPEQIFDDLETSVGSHRKEWSRGRPTDWANESFQIASTEIYRNRQRPEASEPVILPPDYAHAEREVAAVQLTKAGLRLAVVLNAALK